MAKDVTLDFRKHAKEMAARSYFPSIELEKMFTEADLEELKKIEAIMKKNIRMNQMAAAILERGPEAIRVLLKIAKAAFFA